MRKQVRMLNQGRKGKNFEFINKMNRKKFCLIYLRTTLPVSIKNIQNLYFSFCVLVPVMLKQT